MWWIIVVGYDEMYYLGYCDTVKVQALNQEDAVREAIDKTDAARDAFAVVGPLQSEPLIPFKIED